jgi:hypothetical protein
MRAAVWHKGTWLRAATKGNPGHSEAPWQPDRAATREEVRDVLEFRCVARGRALDTGGAGPPPPPPAQGKARGAGCCAAYTSPTRAPDGSKESP